MMGNFFMLLLSSADFFKINFLKKNHSGTLKVSNSLDPAQDRRFVGPDLHPNCIQRLSADNNVRC